MASSATWVGLASRCSRHGWVRKLIRPKLNTDKARKLNLTATPITFPIGRRRGGWFWGSRKIPLPSLWAVAHGTGPPTTAADLGTQIDDQISGRPKGNGQHFQTGPFATSIPASRKLPIALPLSFRAEVAALVRLSSRCPPLLPRLCVLLCRRRCVHCFSSRRLLVEGLKWKAGRSSPAPQPTHHRKRPFALKGECVSTGQVYSPAKRIVAMRLSTRENEKKATQKHRKKRSSAFDLYVIDKVRN